MPWPVLLLCRELDLGGSERQMTETAKSLDRSRFEPHVGAFLPEGMRARELRALGIPVVEFPVYSFQSAGAVRQAFRLAAYIRRHGIRVVHAWDYPLNVFAIPVARVMTNAVALKSQRSHRELLSGSYRKLERATDRFAHATVVNCEFVRDHLVSDEHIPIRRIELCHNGIDLVQFEGLKRVRRREFQASSVVIGVVCALRPEKDLPTLITAFAGVRELHSGASLAIVGSGSMLEELKSLARSLAIENACVFVPATRDVPEWLASIDIFVMPSRSEAFSNAIMEAMACGCAVVASNLGGNRELVKHGDTGLLFKPADAGALAKAINQLIADVDLRRRLAAAAQTRIREQFSNTAAAHRMGEIYESLIQANSSCKTPL